MPRSLSANFGRGLLVLLVAVSALAGCSDDEPPGAIGPAPSAAVAASPGAGAEIDDPPGTITCHRLVEAVAGATLMQPGVVSGIVSASATADAPVSEAAYRLSRAYASAVAAKGSDREPDAVAAVSAAGADMAGVCADSGLETVG